MTIKQHRTSCWANRKKTKIRKQRGNRRFYTVQINVIVFITRVHRTVPFHTTHRPLQFLIKISHLVNNVDFDNSWPISVKSSAASSSLLSSPFWLSSKSEQFTPISWSSSISSCASSSPSSPSRSKSSSSSSPSSSSSNDSCSIS